MALEEVIPNSLLLQLLTDAAVWFVNQRPSLTRVGLLT
jgi:hypothetical protein